MMPMRSAYLLASCALLAAGVAHAGAPNRTTIAPGVVALITNSGQGVTTVEEVRISPSREPDQPTPDLTPMLEAAFNWCTGKTPNGFQRNEFGHTTDHSCRIALDAGVYLIRRTSILRFPRPALQMTIDLGSAVIVHAPERPQVLSVKQLESIACTPENLGDYYNIENPETFDDFRHADPEGNVGISIAKPNDLKTAGCPEGSTICKYGANALRIDFKTPHGLTDGGSLNLGDVIVLSVPNSAYDGQRLLVKEVVDSDTIIVTLPFVPEQVARIGTARETATTVWCNGNRWRAGKPMISVAGPGSVRTSRLTITGGSFLIDVDLFRTAAILIDGDSGPTGTSGAEWVSVDTTHGGNGNLRGQIVVDMGTDDYKRDICQNISVRVDSDAWGHSWSPSVRNLTCATSDITVRQGHGGGVWIGLPVPSYNGPLGVTLRGALQGCYDGPCLWVRSGVVNIADGMKIFGSMWGPQGRVGPARGLVAILGNDQRNPVNVISHGALWGAAQDSDLDCYIRLGAIASFVQIGGQLTSGNADRGYGRETLFCDTLPHKIEDFVLEHVQRRSWGGNPSLVEMSPVNRKLSGFVPQ